MMKKLFSFLILLPVALCACGDSVADELRDGDIIFHTSRSAQSVAIQKATHSKYSHMGIVFFRDGDPYVYEAIKTVQHTPLKKWIARGDGGHYAVKRLRDSARLLTPEGVAKLREADLSDPIVRTKMKERYGKAIPMEETVISPGEMFSFEGLAVVAER